MNFIIGLFFNPSVPSASCSGGKKIRESVR